MFHRLMSDGELAPQGLAQLGLLKSAMFVGRGRLEGRHRRWFARLVQSHHDEVRPVGVAGNMSANVFRDDLDANL